MTPLWLLDVDGVLNAVNLLDQLQRQPEGNWTDYCHGTADAGHRRYSIIWSPTLVGRIAELHKSGAVEVQWLTTWEERAQTELAPMLGLPHFELAGRRDFDAERRRLAAEAASPGDYWWKLPLARAAVADTPQRPLVWTDDDLAGVPEAVTWARQRWQNGDGKTLLCHPRWELGIIPAQMDAIEAFLTGQASWAVRT